MNLDAEGGVLECFTNKSSCCNMWPNREGEWRNPNGSLVEIRGTNRDFHRTRGGDPGVVNLVWTENAMIPEGVFCCEITKIPPSQFTCIGVYPEGAGIKTNSNAWLLFSILLLLTIYRIFQGGKYYC